MAQRRRSRPLYTTCTIIVALIIASFLSAPVVYFPSTSPLAKVAVITVLIAGLSVILIMFLENQPPEKNAGKTGRKKQKTLPLYPDLVTLHRFRD